MDFHLNFFYFKMLILKSLLMHIIHDSFAKTLCKALACKAI